MLDKFSNKLLKKLNIISENGEYKVVDKEELSSLLKASVSAIENGVLQLSKLGFVDIKYEDESVICICTLTKARQEIEANDEKNYLNKKLAKIMFYTCILSASFAFLGAFLANLIFR